MTKSKTITRTLSDGSSPSPPLEERAGERRPFPHTRFESEASGCPVRHASALYLSLELVSASLIIHSFLLLTVFALCASAQVTNYREIKYPPVPKFDISKPTVFTLKNGL